MINQVRTNFLVNKLEKENVIVVQENLRLDVKDENKNREAAKKVDNFLI